MKFSVARKINLELIAKEWKFENEDISVQDADSIEEAHKALDKAVAERIGYLRAKAEANKPPVPVPPATPPAPLLNPATVPPAPAPTPVPPVAPAGPVEGGVSNQPPADFNV